jgi:hypothetical protein
MGTAPQPSFSYEVEKATDESQNAVTTIKCHGRIVSDTAGQVKKWSSRLFRGVAASCSTSPTWNIWTVLA